LEVALQIVRFGIVGLAATAVHAAVAITLVSLTEISPHIANVIAFAVAFSVSFAGHSRFTFRKEGSLWRFIVTALTGFLANVLALEAMLLSSVPAQVAVGLATLAAPIVVFVLSKLWVFGESGQ